MEWERWFWRIACHDELMIAKYKKDIGKVARLKGKPVLGFEHFFYESGLLLS